MKLSSLSRNRPGSTYFACLVFYQTLRQYLMIDFPCLDLTLTASSEDQVLLWIDIQGANFGAVSNDRLNTMLGGNVPQLHECVFRRCE